MGPMEKKKHLHTPTLGIREPLHAIFVSGEYFAIKDDIWSSPVRQIHMLLAPVAFTAGEKFHVFTSATGD